MNEPFHNVIKIITHSFKVDEAAIDELRVVLEQQNKRKISHDEAEQVGRSLITIIESLANGRIITAGKNNDGYQ
jgi:hypothetical protein